MLTSPGLTMVALLSGLCVGCADNATALAGRVGEAASRLNARDVGSSTTATYDPISGTASPYTVVFFPNRSVAEADVVAAGVGKEIAHRIYSELAYLGSTANLLVVEQDGARLTFTTSWKNVAEVRDLVVSQRKTGTAEIQLTRENGTVRVVAIR
jgi:hypothetical protein